MQHAQPQEQTRPRGEPTEAPRKRRFVGRIFRVALQQGSVSNRPSPGGIVRFDHLGFCGTANPGWRGRNANAFVDRSTPG